MPPPLVRSDRARRIVGRTGFQLEMALTGRAERSLMRKMTAEQSASSEGITGARAVLSRRCLTPATS